MILKEKHIFLTGGAKRLGRALAERFLKEGVRLSTTYNTSKEAATELVSLATQQGTSCQIFPFNLDTTKGIKELRSQIYQAHGNLDAAIFSSSDFYPTKLRGVTEKDWDHFQNVNLKTNFFLLQELLSIMPSGVIIFLLDIHSEKPLKNFMPYVTSKAGLRMVMRNLSLELAPHIRVNGISPGPVLLPESFTEEQTQRAKESTLLKRIGSAEDIVEGALFLLKNEYVTGMDLKIDGGASLV